MEELDLEPIELDLVDEHVYDLFVGREVKEHSLGYLTRKDGIIEVPVAGYDLEIKQSLSLLNSKNEAGTTGAVVWKVTPLFAEWLVTSKAKSLISSETTVVELGCGIAGVNASILAPLVKRYLATDQEHILKLCKYNIEQNIVQTQKKNTVKSRRKKKEEPEHESPVEWHTIEYDWEYASQQIGQLNPYIHSVGSNGLIIACDTIYNDYLIPFFVDALWKVAETMADGEEEPSILIAQQLRAEEVLTSVLTALVEKGFQLFNVPSTLLSKELIEGYTVHYLKRNTI
ncbi:hypothetical protein TRVA0_001S03356 [Trichomonascus vanleenenianus]|uniref:S-adenosylmethionine-dependent methyltransferase n=1 Tax=Trichomonascus vanleenenianus TaxID=2268995 RepID=UPI003ECB6048